MARVTDPALIAQLEGMDAPKKKKVTDPALIAQLESEEQQDSNGIMERAAKNLPGDIKNIGEGVISAVQHPIDTLSAIGGLPMGAMANLLPESMTQNMPELAEDKARAAALGRSFVEAVKHPLETFAEKPASTVLNTIGLASGAGGLIKGTLGKAAKTAVQADVANVSKFNALNAPKRAVLAEAQSKGFVIPKSEVAPSFINNRLEGVAGKAALNQESILRNQKAVTAQARKAIGIADDAPITGQAIDNAIKAQYAPYEQIAQLPVRPQTARGYSVNTSSTANSRALLDELKQARHDSQAWYKTAEAQGGNPEMIAKAKALSNRAKAIELEFENRAVAAGKPELVPELRKARTEIAKIYTVDKARNVATGEIDPVILGRALDKAPKKITGELKQIGEFQQAFPKYAKAGEMAQTPGVSKIEAVTSIGGGIGGTAIGGPVGGFVGAMLPLASTPVREMLLSKWYQNKLLSAMEKNPSKIKQFMNTATNKTINKNALMGLIASDKESNNGR